MKKFELTSETKVIFGRTLHRIRALVAFGNVSAGELGGWVENENNLDQSGDAWVYGNAEVYGDARVSGDARVYGNARVSGDARVYGRGSIFWISAIGSRNGTTTFFACKDKSVRVACGCFFGDLEQFAKKVKQTHGDNDHGKVYMLAIEMAKTRIDVSKVPEGEPEEDTNNAKL